MNLLLITLNILNIILIVVQGSEFSESDNNINNNEIDTKELPEVKGNHFYYFGYGSNMLTKRIHLQNPTAVKIGPGVLKNYRLDFNNHSGRWKGAPATVVPHLNRTVQGTLWKIDLSNLDDIDNQEGVPERLPIFPNIFSVTIKVTQTKFENSSYNSSPDIRYNIFTSYGRCHAYNLDPVHFFQYFVYCYQSNSHKV